jgi:hypothetical protein
LFVTCFGWNFNAIAALAAREEEEGGGGGGMQEGGRRSRHLWTFDSRLYLDMSTKHMKISHISFI